MKAALITGAAGGMGLAAAKRLIGEGYRVFGLDIRAPEPIEGLRFVMTDLTDPESVDNAFAAVSAETDSLDCVIDTAGIYMLESLIEISEEEFLKSFSVNLFASYRVNKTFLPLLKPNGRIVMISSELAPLDPLPFTGLYAVTKAAVEKYAFSLRMELQLLGIKVILIRPGAVKTALLDDSTRALERFTETTKLYAVNAKRFRSIVDGVEQRSVQPERIAKAVSRAIAAKYPSTVVNINRNPLLLLLNLLPFSLQCAIIKRILK
ncbi:MAG: SDR family NAD(P)-dependent oxidoreductase [Clostridia bacterium]|nr:SDR family NAD(P)-dependent oxidoreductase [Clostridia bacterium]